MQITVVFVDKSGKSTDFACSARRLPKTLDALVNSADAAGHTDLVDRLENKQATHILSSDEIGLKDLQEQVDADDLDYNTIEADVADEVDDENFEGLEDGSKLYLYELPNKTPAAVAAPAAAAAAVTGDATLISVIVKVHGGEKRNVEVAAGTLVSDVISKSGVRVPAGASYAFGGNDIKGTDRLQHGGMLSIAGKVTGG